MTQISERVIDRAFVTRQHIIRRALLEKLYALFDARPGPCT